MSTRIQWVGEYCSQGWSHDIDWQRWLGNSFSQRKDAHCWICYSFSTCIHGEIPTTRTQTGIYQLSIIGYTHTHTYIYTEREREREREREVNRFRISLISLISLSYSLSLSLSLYIYIYIYIRSIVPNMLVWDFIASELDIQSHSFRLIPLPLNKETTMYIYIYMCVCVCVCVTQPPVKDNYLTLV